MQLIYKGLAGSQLYGTATPESDTDYVEVYLPYKTDIFGLGDKWKGMTQETGDEDFQRFKVNQYVKLLCKGNPNVLETVFCPPYGIVYTHDAWTIVTDNVAALLSKTSIIKSHLGFAIQQLSKMLPASAKDAGPRRRVLCEKYGYDVKYAAHAIRLCHQCSEILFRGFIQYPYQLEFADHLLDIRAGKFTLAEVREEFAERMAKVQKQEQGDCFLNDDNKTSEANVRLYRFYKEIGYAA